MKRLPHLHPTSIVIGSTVVQLPTCRAENTYRVTDRWVGQTTNKKWTRRLGTKRQPGTEEKRTGQARSGDAAEHDTVDAKHDDHSSHYKYSNHERSHELSRSVDQGKVDARQRNEQEEVTQLELEWRCVVVAIGCIRLVVHHAWSRDS